MGLGIGMELGMGRVGFDVRVLNPSKILLLDVEKGGDEDEEEEDKEEVTRWGPSSERITSYTITD